MQVTRYKAPSHCICGEQRHVRRLPLVYEPPPCVHCAPGHCHRCIPNCTRRQLVLHMQRLRRRLPHTPKGKQTCAAAGVRQTTFRAAGVCAADGHAQIYSGEHKAVARASYRRHCLQHNLTTLGDNHCVIQTDFRVSDVFRCGQWCSDPVALWSWQHRGTGIMTNWERAETLCIMLRWHLQRQNTPEQTTHKCLAQMTQRGT